MSGQASGNYEVRLNTAGKIELFDVQNLVVQATSNTALNTSNFFTIAAQYNANTGAYAFYLNGSADGSGTIGTETSVSAFARMGRRSGNGDPYIGDIAYNTLWNSFLDSTALTEVFDDLRAVWAHY